MNGIFLLIVEGLDEKEPNIPLKKVLDIWEAAIKVDLQTQ